MAENNQKNEAEDLNSTNIFEEFEGGESLEKEIAENKGKEKNDIYFYLSKIGIVFQVIFFVGFFAVLLSFLYVYVQENESLVNSQELDPFCSIFLGDTPNTDSYCSSLFGLHQKYEREYNDEKTLQAKKILGVIDGVYQRENFTESKDVVFLSTKTKDRTMVTHILSAFDDIKKSYEPLEKEKIQCNDIVITSDNTLTAKCEAYSAGYEKGIKGFDGSDTNKVEGTSISIANSFLNYIEKTSNTFQVVNRQKTFLSQKIIGNKTGFTNKTLFNLELQYSVNNLSL